MWNHVEPARAVLLRCSITRLLQAINAMNGQQLDGRNIRVSRAGGGESRSSSSYKAGVVDLARNGTAATGVRPGMDGGRTHERASDVPATAAPVQPPYSRPGGISATGGAVPDGYHPRSRAPDLPLLQQPVEQAQHSHPVSGFSPRDTRSAEVSVPARTLLQAAVPQPVANLAGGHVAGHARSMVAPPGLSTSAHPAVPRDPDPNIAKFSAARSKIMQDAVQQYCVELGDKQQQEKGVDTRPGRDRRWADIGSGADTIRFGARDMEIFAKEHGLAPYESLFESPNPDYKPGLPLAECQSCCNVFAERQSELDCIRPAPKIGIRSTPRASVAPPAAQKQQEETDFDVFDPKSASIPELVQRADETGDAELQYMIGKRHANDLPPNLTEAAKWFTKAAKNKHRKAQLAVAKIHADENRTSSTAGTKQDTAVRYLTTQCGWSHMDAVTEITGRPPPQSMPAQSTSSFENVSEQQWQQSTQQAAGSGHWGNARYDQQHQQLQLQHQHGGYQQRPPPDSRDDYRKDEQNRQPQARYGSARDSYGQGGSWANRYGPSPSSSSQQQPARSSTTESAGWAGRSVDSRSNTSKLTDSVPPGLSSSSTLSAPAAVTDATASSSLNQGTPMITGKIPKKKGIPKIPKTTSNADRSGGGWYEQAKVAAPLKREREDAGRSAKQSESKKPRADPEAGRDDRNQSPNDSSNDSAARSEKKQEKDSHATATSSGVESKAETSAMEVESKSKPSTQQQKEEPRESNLKAIPTKKNGKQQKKVAPKKKEQDQNNATAGSATLFPVDMLTWAKVGHYPYWPAKVISIDQVADVKSQKQLIAAQKNKKKKIADAVLVMFYQSKDVSWIRPDRIAKFSGSDSAPDGSTKRSPDFDQAVEEALEQMQSNLDWESSTAAGDSSAAPSAESRDDVDDTDDALRSSSSESQLEPDDASSSSVDEVAKGGTLIPSGNSNINALKAKYKKLKGTSARGSQANNTEWLQARIAEMESGESSVKTGKKQQPAAAVKQKKTKPTKKTANKPSDEGGSQSAASTGQGSNVASLKKRYTQLKGSAPRGSKANEAAWLQAKVAELEAAQTVEAVDDSSSDDSVGATSASSACR